MMLNKRENTPIVPREEERKSEQTRIDISVEIPEINNGQDSQDIDFSITKLDGKAYDRNKTIANSVRSLCKCCFEEFRSDLEFLEHLQRSFKCVINDTQCVVCKRYCRENCGLNQHLVRSDCQSIMLKQGPNAAFPDHCLPKKAVIQSRRHARIITTASCLGMEREKREGRSWKVE